MGSDPIQLNTQKSRDKKRKKAQKAIIHHSLTCCTQKTFLCHKYMQDWAGSMNIILKVALFRKPVKKSNFATIQIKSKNLNNFT